MSNRLKPIRSDAAYEMALEEMDELWGAKLGTPRGDRLDVIATLVEAYEAKNFPIDAPDPISAIEFRMEQRGLTRKDLTPLIGSRNRVAEVLNGKRALSIGMIRKLRDNLNIPADILVGPSEKEASRKSKSETV